MGWNELIMDDIHKIYRMLNWENSEDVQAEGFRLASDIEKLSLLIQPPSPPSVWEACALILSEKTDIQLKPYLNGILEWLQDLNRPGALTILNRLKKFSGKLLREAFLDSYNQAVEMNNDDGMQWIDYLSDLLDNDDLKIRLPEDIVADLQKHYKNWGYWYEET